MYDLTETKRLNARYISTSPGTVLARSSVCSYGWRKSSISDEAIWRVEMSYFKKLKRWVINIRLAWRWFKLKRSIERLNKAFEVLEQKRNENN